MKLYFGLDGGASSTRAVIIDADGNTLAKQKIHLGTNLKVYEEIAPKRIADIVQNLCSEIYISVDDISAFGFGLAAVSYDPGRELLFKELDRLNIADKSILINDAEAAYKVTCIDDIGILMTVGTGVIGIAKTHKGDFVRVAGKGHDQSDIGSGYWLGKELLLKLSFNEAIVNHDNNLNQLYNKVLNQFNATNLNEALEIIASDENSLSLKASLGKIVIEASNSNDIALSILQEATVNVADYILDLNSLLDYNHSDDVVLFGNGSIIKSKEFRKSLNDSLSFNFKNISWIFSDLSASYGSAMLAAISKNNHNILIKNILKGDYLVSS